MEYKYVWLNMVTGEFSNSWSEDTHNKHGQTLIDSVKNSDKGTDLKLIKYQCLTDESFDFYQQMKLR